VSLLTVPLYLARIGEARFGILSIIWLLLGYFGLFDLGLGMASAQQIAAREAEGKQAQVRIFWTALLTNLGLGVIGGLIAWPVAQYYFGHVMKVDEAFRSEILLAVPWLILAVPLATVTGVATGTLQGLHRFATLNSISVAGTMLFQLLPLAAAYTFSTSLTVVLPMAILARLLTLAALWLDCHLNLLRKHKVAYDASMVRVLLTFGFWVTISAFFAPLMTMIDRFVIGAFVSAAAVSAYAVPYNLGDRLCVIGNAAGSALFPRFSSLGKDETSELAYKSERVLLGTMVPVSIVAIFLVRPFISVWVSPEFSMKSAPAGVILMAGIWLDAVSRIPLYALRGQFRPAAVAKIDLMVLLPYWLCLYWMISNFGIEGVAAAYVFRVGLNYLLLSGAAGTLARIRWILVACAASVLLALVAAWELEPLSLPWFLSFGSCVLVGAVLAANIVPATERQLIGARLRRVIPYRAMSR
jgi:O-antigen/teichoic acid export membrane protein